MRYIIHTTDELVKALEDRVLLPSLPHPKNQRDHMYNKGFADGMREAIHYVRQHIETVNQDHAAGQPTASQPAEPVDEQGAMLLAMWNRLGVKTKYVDANMFNTAIDQGLPLVCEGKTAVDYFLQGVAEIEAAGLTLSSGSFIEPFYTYVSSQESVPNTWGHPRAEFSAKILDGSWNISRTGTVREIADMLAKQQ